MKFVLSLIFSITVFHAVSQNIYLSGFVKDEITKESIIGAGVYLPTASKGTTTNTSGYFTLIVPIDTSEIRIEVYAYGYEKREIVFVPDQHKSLLVLLKEQIHVLDDVVITNSKQNNRPTIGVIDIPIKHLKNIPNLGGEADVIKAFQLMPGVQGGKEGTSGLYVRGGTPDQNLFLLDNTPLYYVSHIGGFVSTFDPNAINDIKLYKGGFPARYNGRLSSVVDIRMKDGNSNRRKGEVVVGLLSSKYNVEGPFKRDSTMTFFFSIRRSNFDFLTRLAALIDTDGESMAGYTFYDINAKIVKRYENGAKLSFTFYNGRDRIFINSSAKSKDSRSIAYKYKANVKWGNTMGTLRYTKALSERTFGEISIASTNFNYNTGVSGRYSQPGSNNLVNKSSIQFDSGVKDLIIGAFVESKINPSYSLVTGVNTTFHFFTPGKIEYIQNNARTTESGVGTVFAFENSLFAENHIALSDRLELNVGANVNQFSTDDTTFYSFQPRILITYMLSGDVSLQIAYSKMNQNIHYLTNSGMGLPSDLWIPVNKMLLPERSNQYNIGLTYSLKNKPKIDFTIEAFYKDMYNMIEYRDGANLFQGVDLDSKILGGGYGEMYGFEFLAHKKQGRCTGWIAYTWSKNIRRFEQLNNGDAFPFIFDRRHDISTTFSYEINPKMQFTATWVYASGAPITLAQAQHNLVDIGHHYRNRSEYNQFPIFNDAHIYNGRNNYRLPDYHKLDVGCTMSKQKKKGVRVWFLGIYNVYNRQNPFMLYYKVNREEETSLHQLTLFPIIPSAAYSFVF